ncbi:hypothetical protein BJ138DRAFT_1014824, partial [Hygrophoropsis aurantiaca]
ILTDCTKGPQKIIWERSKRLWPHHHAPWTHPSIGAILGCGSIKRLKDANNEQNETLTNPIEVRKPKYQDGKARLLSILLAESAYLIWVIRCEIVIQGKEIPDRIIAKRWIDTINRRIQTDRFLAKNRNYRKINSSLVKNTWKGTLKNEESIQTDWVTALEVLVGIDSPDPSI